MSTQELLRIEPSTAREEFEDKREQLAEFLHDLYYRGGFELAGAETQLNYRHDAEEVLLSQPHLLSLPTRVLMWRDEGTRMQAEARLSVLGIAAVGLTGDWAHFADEMKDADDFEHREKH